VVKVERDWGERVGVAIWVLELGGEARFSAIYAKIQYDRRFDRLFHYIAP